jgi:hypothetical protein
LKKFSIIRHSRNFGGEILGEILGLGSRVENARRVLLYMYRRGKGGAYGFLVLGFVISVLVLRLPLSPGMILFPYHVLCGKGKLPNVIKNLFHFLCWCDTKSSIRINEGEPANNEAHTFVRAFFVC